MTTPRPLSDWGPWKLDPETEIVFHSGERFGNYPIDLGRCKDSAEILDWIAQIAGKTWGAEPDVLAGLVHALNDIFRLQASVCGGGTNSRLSEADVSQLVRIFAAREDAGERLGKAPL